MNINIKTTMLKKIALLLMFIITNISMVLAQSSSIRGRVLDEKGEPLVGALVVIEGSQIGTQTEDGGRFKFTNLENRVYKIKASFIGYAANIKSIDLRNKRENRINFTLVVDNSLNEVEVFGERYKQPEKLDAITRMPLRPSEQIQSISVISDKVITEQGALSITDAIRNVPGVTLFGSYGGLRESMSIRGYRGVPILKNGVSVDSDFRTGSLTSDMQGVESIQVIKGSAAVTQGIGDGLGSPGGVINVVTKTPKFVNRGEVNMRVGSWGLFRPTFDIQNVLDKSNRTAFRLNGAFERADGFKKITKSDHIYINPSFEWRPDDKTTITLEMDYMNENRTPDRGTVNLEGDSIYNMFNMPHNRFLGFATDNANTKITTYAARFVRKINESLSLRAAYFGSQYELDQTGATISANKGQQHLPQRTRSLARSSRNDKNQTIQLDLIGRDVMLGSLKNTFQLGFDYKHNDLTEVNYNLQAVYKNISNKDSIVSPTYIDIIDVTQPINNTLPTYPSYQFVAATPKHSSKSSYGWMAQEVLTINQYIKTILGVRYSYQISESSAAATGKTTGDAWDPMFGIMLTPIKNVNVFGSYTTTTSLRSASQVDKDGGLIGASRSKQFEAGFKSDWLDNRLRLNFTYFNILNSNTSYGVYDETGKNVLYYDNAGDVRRDGIEIELSGRILENLQIMTGYSYTNPRYKNSPAYVEGSSPINTAKHTANGWIHYIQNKGILKGFTAGVGAYYVGKRPVNDYTAKVNVIHNTTAGVKPFDMPSYITWNAQLSYSFKNMTTRVYFNNIFDKIGYTSYFRGGYINQIDPRNFAGSISYTF